VRGSILAEKHFKSAGNLEKAKFPGQPRRVFLHTDMDAFFVSVERLLDPSLRKKPVIVTGGPSRRGVVSSASYEAREKGVRSAMPLVRALRLCPEATIIPGNFAAYARYSNLVMEILHEYTPFVEQAGIDEAYLDLTGCRLLFGNPAEVARRIRQRIREELGLPSSAGLSSAMIVSKVASALAKPNGFIEVPPGAEASFLAPLPVDALPGVGPSCRLILAEMGIRKIGELALLPPEALEAVLGSWGRTLHEYSRGIDRRRIESSEMPGSVSREMTFESDTFEYEFLRSVLLLLCDKCCAALRKGALASRRVSVKVRYSDFDTRIKSRTLPCPTDREQNIYPVALELLERLLTRGVRVRLLGVNLSALVPYSAQYELFPRTSPSGDPEKIDRLNRSLDLIRKRFGFEAIMRAGALNSARGEKTRKPPVPEPKMPNDRCQAAAM